MSSETDLSTADLAQPGGSRQQDRTDDEQDRGRSEDASAGTGERAYETSGNRVADPGDQDTVELAPAGGSAGSTRDDAARGDAPYPGRSGLGDDDRGTAGQDMGGRDMADRDMGDRGVAGQGMADRDMAGQGMTGQGVVDQGVADRDTADRDTADRDTADRDIGDRGLAGQGMAGQGMADRDMAGQGMTGQGVADRGMAGQGMADRDLGDRDMAGQGTSGRGGEDAGGDVALLDPTDAEGFRQRWSDTQARFVDDPREAVQTADGLVAELMQTLASSFSQHKGELEAHWRSGGDPDTEDLRQALQRYRSFFDRLLSA
jgi:hypothetical protein